MKGKNIFAILSCFCLACTISSASEDENRTVLKNLREFRVKGYLGRFIVPRDPLLQELRKRKQDDPVCGNEVVLELPDSSEPINETGELVITFSTVDDLTLASELSCDMKERFATSYEGLVFLTRYVSKSGHGLINLMELKLANNKQVSDPYSTNSAHGYTSLDRIERFDNGSVAFYKGDDLIILDIRVDKDCSNQEDALLRDDINEVSGRKFHKTSYPLPFDYWKCDDLAWNVSFCKTLAEHECDLSRVGNDVCTRSDMTHRHYCPANISLISATGYFHHTLSEFVPGYPLISFEAEMHEKHHSTGIVYPCLT